MLSSVAQHDLVIMNMLLNKFCYTNKITNQITNANHKIRGSGGPGSVNVTSQWLLILTPHHSSQYIIVLLLIHDLSLHDWALRAATKLHPVLKKSLYISPKILLVSTLKSPPKIEHWMSSICLVYIGYWQHSHEIESSKLECIYHESLATRCINCEISWNLICFQFSFCLHSFTTSSLIHVIFRISSHELKLEKK